MLSDFVKQRYASWDSGIGQKIEAGKANFEDLEKYMLEKGDADAERLGPAGDAGEHHQPLFAMKSMADLTRISISLETALLEAFDRSNAGKGYATRSEAVRDLIRERLIREEASGPQGGDAERWPSSRWSTTTTPASWRRG